MEQQPVYLSFHQLYIRAINPSEPCLGVGLLAYPPEDLDGLLHFSSVVPLSKAIFIRDEGAAVAFLINQVIASARESITDPYYLTDEAGRELASAAMFQVTGGFSSWKRAALSAKIR